MNRTRCEDLPKMSREDENALVEKAREGCMESMDRLYRQYLPFLQNSALKVERKYRSVDYDDALQQGTLYFMNAVRTYQSSHGTGLSFWVVMCVAQKLRRFWRSQTTIRLPENSKGVDLKRTADAMSVVRFSEMETNGKLGRSSVFDPCDNSTKDPLDAAISSEQSDSLWSALLKLKPLDRALILAKLDGLQLVDCGRRAAFETGKKIGATRQAAGQRMSRAIDRLCAVISPESESSA